MSKSKIMLLEADVLELRHFHKEIFDTDQIFQVLVCKQTDELMELFQNFRPDILVIGPATSGPHEVIQKIRALPEGQGVPVLTLNDPVEMEPGVRGREPQDSFTGTAP